ncbi:glycine zipper 2TM domain-containing protein [Halobacterium litoreum]|uniref:Glycine zipper 2TM domain-containing protein n=1 Tax=Halobacterium litoreum TaxID=2039234 RepID=A0ABD5NCP0_9EURY|nr:glycine zipper 2TM domain-containing protein [Halobacterium litoreum]UHH14185.1 glycine zipper 2TM domain-containing protein [Halobacterium litoreum]
MSRLKRVFSRAKYAAIGAAAGGFLGGLASRNAASTGAGVGALVGAIVGEKRVDVSAVVDDVKEKKPSRSGDD